MDIPGTNQSPPVKSQKEFFMGVCVGVGVCWEQEGPLVEPHTACDSTICRLTLPQARNSCFRPSEVPRFAPCIPLFPLHLIGTQSSGGKSCHTDNNSNLIYHLSTRSAYQVLSVCSAKHSLCTILSAGLCVVVKNKCSTILSSSCNILIKHVDIIFWCFHRW